MILNFNENFVKWEGVRLNMKTKAETYDLQNAHNLYALFAMVVKDDEPI